MLRNSMSYGIQLHCGGMILIIAEHLSLHIPNNPTDIIPGRTRLFIDVMETMHLFHCYPNEDVHWTVDGASKSARPIPFPEHNLYMGEFARLDHHYTSLQQEVVKICTCVSEHTSEFQDYRNLQEERWAQ
ncbi:unnamed protein product [Lactuca saligna]|uniref:Uncharacterized protein n=1 Tax=Lactuca saligna TaxID=75948 RepID=A0AA35Y7N5_LACSI|nr:unnamed protein product [Lactuca saligna]